MRAWKVKSSTLLILGCVVVFMLAIVVLPFVDLPDTAFHRDTAPIVVHAQATTVPAAILAASGLTPVLTASPSHAQSPADELAATSDPNFRPILLRSIRR